MELYEHQVSAIQSAIERRHVLLIRSLGSGKTAIALHIVRSTMERRAGPALFVGPAHLLSQYCEEARKWGFGFPVSVLRNPLPSRIEPNTCYCVSYDLLRRHRARLTEEHWPLVIVDEFQHGKNPDTLNAAVFARLRGSADSFVGMTGAPFQNGPYEFFSLLSLIAGRDLGAQCERCLEYRVRDRSSPLKLLLYRVFRVRRNRGPIVGIRSPEKLRDIALRYVDYVDPSRCRSQGGIPSVAEDIRYVDIGDAELRTYGKILRTHRKRKDAQFLEDSLDEESIESACKRMSDLRQCLLCCDSHPSAKVRAVAAAARESMSSAGARILVFTNFVTCGVDTISRALTEEGVMHSTYTGSVGREVRERIIGDFLSARVRALVLSPVGHEGLDLTGASHVFIADPHYNPERTAQLIARATRSGADVRRVKVVHFISRSAALKNGTIDEAIWRISERKRRINDMMASLLKP